MVSIIIPAHNEVEVIADCLQQLVHTDQCLDLEIIVVCNGCSDGTADIVRSFDRVICLETDVASKTNALNLGDKAATCFPRFYLDADIRLSINDISIVVAAMKKEKALLAVPKAQMDFTDSSWAVKSYYDVWCNLPYCREGMYGAGVYAVSEEGRKRFAEFPAINSDGLFIRSMFKQEEKIGVRDAVSIVNAPTSLSGLITMKARGRMGIRRFKLNYPELAEKEEKDYGMAVKELIGKINLWPKVLVYLVINVASRIRARKMIKAKGFDHWEKEKSGRKKAKSNSYR